MIAVGLRCCAWTFSSCRGLLTAVASLVAEPGLRASGLWKLPPTGSGAQVQWLWRTGSLASRHVRSSWTGHGSHGPCVGRLGSHPLCRQGGLIYFLFFKNRDLLQDELTVIHWKPMESISLPEEDNVKVTDFLLLGSKITANADCSHEIKRRLFLERKAVASLNSILKSRDITLLTKVL